MLRCNSKLALMPSERNAKGVTFDDQLVKFARRLVERSAVSRPGLR